MKQKPNGLKDSIKNQKKTAKKNQEGNHPILLSGRPLTPLEGEFVPESKRDVLQKEFWDFLLGIHALSPFQCVLDLGCGSGEYALELGRRGFNVEGFERSGALFQKAKLIAKREGLSVCFREGKRAKLPFLADQFDCVVFFRGRWERLDKEQGVLEVLKEVQRVLKPCGTLLIDIPNEAYVKEHCRERRRVWEWLDQDHFVCQESTLSPHGDKVLVREVVTHVEKGVLLDEIYPEYLYTQESIQSLLESLGFSQVEFHQRPKEEERLLITARSSKEWSSSSLKGGPAAKRVLVLLGDPKRQDLMKPNAVFDEDDFYTIHQLKAALRSLPGYWFFYLDHHPSFLHELSRLKNKIDYVFNLCDEGYQNDPRKELHVPALLEMLGIPYTGAGPQSMAYCYDKFLVQGIAKEMGVPVPETLYLYPEEVVEEKIGALSSFPYLVKPNFGDSSFGITEKSVVHEKKELLEALAEIQGRFGYKGPILIEEFLSGREISVGVIGNVPGEYTVLPITEEDYSEVPAHLPKICGYEAKWDPHSPYAKIRSLPVELPKELEEKIISWCLQLFQRLECRDYARFDWRFDKAGHPKLLEANPNPGWCWDGHLAKMAQAKGQFYPQMLEALLQAAEKRIGRRVKTDA